nr:MAG TPA: hypothetical protein [Caudoviricetes sp.]
MRCNLSKVRKYDVSHHLTSFAPIGELRNFASDEEGYRNGRH